MIEKGFKIKYLFHEEIVSKIFNIEKTFFWEFGP